MYFIYIFFAIKYLSRRKSKGMVIWLLCHRAALMLAAPVIWEVVFLIVFFDHFCFVFWFFCLFVFVFCFFFFFFLGLHPPHVEVPRLGHSMYHRYSPKKNKKKKKKKTKKKQKKNHVSFSLSHFSFFYYLTSLVLILLRK